VINQFGALNTFWRSDLFISAAGANGGAFTLTFVNARTGERITQTGAIRDHRALRLQDVAGNLFGSAGAFGTVRADLPDGVVATSRTFTSTSSGTFGQFIPLQHAEEGSAPLSPGGPARQLLHVERSASFRTNLGAINTGGSDALLRFTLYDAAGTTRGTVERTIAPLQAVQFPIDALSSDPLVAGRVEVQMISGSRGAIAWASVVDNVTGDPIFVPAQ
jgi:hypothetical protein